ncbi:histone [Candidatus Bathyarchaeota archaeon]|nr:MAG: histone [Candidatus Bathyarchaeota archaeon]RLI19088.1 MAG: histone [Candidatus Bathyarchaeota archaeon]
MRRLLKRFGDIRVSVEASEELRRVIGEYGERIARAAVANARREGRKTVLARDVKAAKREVESKR